MNAETLRRLTSIDMPAESLREAAKRGTDAAGIIEAVLINAFESEWFLRVVLKEDGGE